MMAGVCRTDHRKMMTAPAATQKTIFFREEFLF
jgi:hypothetical protein